MKYVLISFYNRGTNSIPFWEVYGHISFGHNENIGTYKTEDEAMREALSYGSYGVPAIRGSNQSHLAELMRRVKETT